MRHIVLLLALPLLGCDPAPAPADAPGMDAGRSDSGGVDGGGTDAPVDVGMGELASSITQYGITWTFDRAYPTGTFVTGDPWVVGPVTIVSIDPAPTGTRNGSVVNPTGGHQGYDDRGGEYDDEENVTLPVTLMPDESLVSSISKPDDGGDFRNVGCLRAQAVLTAIAAPVSATTFRPAYAGTYKRYFDAATIRWELLPELEAPSDAPDVADLAHMLDRPRIDHLSSWTIQDSCAEENWDNGEGAHACYGREVATVISDAALAVMLADPDRDELALALIQHGIDNYGVLRAGGSWHADGGHHNARKLPVVFAARMLDDCDMLAVGADYAGDFGEDGHTYLGEDGTALFGSDCGGGRGTYFEDGCMGGGARDCRDPAGRLDACPDYRDCCTSAYWVGQALAARMLGAEGVWDHPPFFDYVDRWMAGDVSGDGETSSPFVETMWTTYRDAPVDLPAPAVCD